MARNSELEALIAKSADDPSNYLVYADWLIQQSDPLGELISTSVKRETSGGSDLADKEKALHDEHDATWLGELADQSDGFSVTWKRGFLHEVTFGDDESAEIEHDDLYKKLRPLPVAQFVRSLKFAAFGNDDGE